jgi:arsenite methyltransferase
VVARHLPPQVGIESTFKVPFLVIVKTADRALPAEVQQRIRDLKKGLRSRYRSDLNDMRIFFALGGLKNDPF